MQEVRHHDERTHLLSVQLGPGNRLTDSQAPNLSLPASARRFSKKEG
jgi:hypothetical protein